MRQQLDDKSRRIDELNNKNQNLRDSLDEKTKIHKELEKQMEVLSSNY